MDNSNAEFRRHSRRLFAVLRAIVRRGGDGPAGERDFVARLESRIGALGRAHEMLMRTPGDGIDLEELVHGELLAQVVPPARYRVSGPDTRISADAVLPLALALHELAVNAVMHGAFMDEEGSLDISWRHEERDSREWLRMTWQESTARGPTTPRSAKGFGMELIERSLPYELDARARVEWQSAGARVDIDIPGGQTSSSWRPAERTPP